MAYHVRGLPPRRRDDEDFGGWMRHVVGPFATGELAADACQALYSLGWLGLLVDCGDINVRVLPDPDRVAYWRAQPVKVYGTTLTFRRDAPPPGFDVLAYALWRPAGPDRRGLLWPEALGDFRPDNGRVERRGKSCYAHLGELYAAKQVRHDGLADPAAYAVTLGRLDAASRAAVADAIRSTNLLSAEGKAERLAVLAAVA